MYRPATRITRMEIERLIRPPPGCSRILVQQRAGCYQGTTLLGHSHRVLANLIYQCGTAATGTPQPGKINADCRRTATKTRAGTEGIRAVTRGLGVVVGSGRGARVGLGRGVVGWARGVPAIASLPLGAPGRGAGVGRGLGVARGLGVGVGLIVAVGLEIGVGVVLGVEVGVGVDVGVEVVVGVAVTVAVAVGVGVGVAVGSIKAYTLLSAPK